MAWFPLAPGEVYMPYYRGSRGYVERLNVTNTVVNVTRVTNVYNVYNSNQRNVTNITYVNQRVNNGVTVVSRDTFVNARPVGRNLGHVDARQIAEAPVERGVPVQPVRASVLGAGAPARVRPPQAVINRQVVATQRPAPPKQPFEQRQATNIRTVQPAQPQPLNNQPRNNQPLNNQGVARPVARPQEPARPAETPEAPSSGMPRPEARPQRPIVAPRVTEPIPPEAAAAVPRPPQGRDNQSPDNHQLRNNNNEVRGNDNRNGQNGRFSQGWSHPQARPVPPVQERNAAQSRDDENKFRNWQQQRQQAAPPQRQPPRQQEDRSKAQKQN